MPTYQYACTSCGAQLEVVQKFSDDPLTECPECAGRLRKVFSAVGVVFKGSGFYRNDSRSDSKSNGSKHKSEPAASSESKSDSSSSSESSTKSESGSKSESGAKSESKSSDSSSSSGSSSSTSSSSSKPEKVA